MAVKSEAGQHRAARIQVVGIDVSDGLDVTVEAKSIELVTGAEARRLAIKAAAAEGYSRCGITSSSGPFIVDEQGKSSESQDAEERWAEEAEIARSGRYAYRNTFKLLQGIGT